MAKGDRVRALRELHSMGRSGFAVGQWYQYNERLEGAYEVSTLAPLAAREPVQFMTTEANHYRKLVRESREVDGAQGRSRTGGGSCAHSLTRSSNPPAARPSSGASTDRASSHSEWLPLNIERLTASNMDSRELGLTMNKMLSMGRTGFVVNEWYRFSLRSATVYEVNSRAPIEFCDAMYFMSTEAERYHGPIYNLHSEHTHPDDDLASARDCRSHFAGAGRVVRVTIVDPNEGEDNSVEEMHDI